MTRAIRPPARNFRPQPRSHRPLRHLVAGLSLAAIASALSLAAAPATAATTSDDGSLAGLNYVALGDSYSAGYGLEPYSKTTPADGCYQAVHNYPHQVAAALGLNLTDRTCSNAVTANIIDTPQNTGSGTAPVQSNYLSADTDIVTVTIGGNDIWFAYVAATCLAARADGPLLILPWLNECKSLWDYTIDGQNVDILLDRLQDVVTPSLAKTYQTIEEKAPNAKLFVIGYPAIAPDAGNIPEPPGSCFTELGIKNAYPFTNVDVPYLHMIQGALNKAIQQQAQLAGATFIPTFAQTESKTPCASNPDAYVNGITVDFSDYTGPTIPEDSPYFVDGHFTSETFEDYVNALRVEFGPGYDAIPGVALGALHPNEAGVTFLKEQVIDALRAAGLNGDGGDTGTAGTGPTESAAPKAELAATGSDATGWLALSAFLLAAGAVAFTLRRRWAR